MGFECQSSDVENISADSAHMNAMLGNPELRGVKRKLDEEEYSDSMGYMDTVQRQSVFNISIYKLSRFRQVADPCLLQSVLICNTLRHIERELEQDGIKLPYDSGSTALIPPLNSQAAVTLDPSPNSLHITSSGNTHLSTNSEALKYYLVSSVVTSDHNSSANSEYDRYLQELDSSGRKTPFIRTAYDRMDTGALCYEENDRLTSLNWSSVLNFTTLGNGGASLVSDDTYSSCAASNNHISGEFNPSLHTLMPPTSVSSSANTSILPSIMLNFTSSSTASNSNPASSPNSTAGSSNISSIGDEIFGDIDLSLYDFDLLSPLSPPNIKMAPVTAEELMKSLTNNSESLCQPGNTCKQERLNEDHDLITVVKS